MIGTMMQVALGGAVGAVLRWGAGLALAFPYATVAVNVLGSFLIGLVWVAVAARWHPLLITGVLGGFTTFSAFSLDLFRLIEGGRAGAAFAYTGASVALSLGACWAGLMLGRAVG
jgi:fluoride exporter